MIPKGQIDYTSGAHFMVIDTIPYIDGLLKVPLSQERNNRVPLIVEASEYLSKQFKSVLPAKQINCIVMPHAPGRFYEELSEKEKEHARELQKKEEKKIEEAGWRLRGVSDIYYDGEQVYLIDLSDIQKI